MHQQAINTIYEMYSTASTNPPVADTDMPDPDTDAPTPEEVDEINDSVRSYLVDGDAAGYGDDGSAALMGAVQTLYNLGYSDSQVLGIVSKSKGAMATAMKRKTSRDQALQWVWKYTCLKASRNTGSANINPAPLVAPVTRKTVTSPSASALAPQGALKEVMDYMLGTSMYPQPIFAVGAATALLSLLIGNRFSTEDGVFGNLYIIAIGETGCGKDSPRKGIKWLAQEYGRDTQVPDSVASGAGLEDFLSYFGDPHALLLLDELGKYLQQFTGRKGDEHGVIGILLKMYTAVDSYYSKRIKAGDEPQVIHRPFVSIYGTTTEGQLQKAITADDTEAGWLGRFIFLPSHQNRPKWTHPKPMNPVPQVISTWVHTLAKTNPVNATNTQNSTDVSNDQANKPNVNWRPPIKVQYETAAKQELDRYQTEMDRHLQSDSIHPIVRASSVRVVEMAKKLALISAISRDPDRPSISIDDVNWAIALIGYSKTYVEESLAPAIEEGVADSLENQQISKCLNIITNARTYNDTSFSPATKRGFMPHRMLQKKMKLKSSTLRGIIDSLLQSGQIAKASLTKDRHGINCDTAYYIPESDA
ncbi:MAG: DUF3987 domain-containing protein [bacterium]